MMHYTFATNGFTSANSLKNYFKTERKILLSSDSERYMSECIYKLSVYNNPEVTRNYDKFQIYF